MSIWDDLDKEASVDNRLGNHDFIVDKITDGEWEPGRSYRELLHCGHSFGLGLRETHSYLHRLQCLGCFVFMGANSTPSHSSLSSRFSAK